MKDTVKLVPILSVGLLFYIVLLHSVVFSEGIVIQQEVKVECGSTGETMGPWVENGIEVIGSCPAFHRAFEKEDDCGNRLVLDCNILKARWELSYNGIIIGKCCYTAIAGENAGSYAMTEDGCRFHSVRWYNVNPHKRGSMDEGKPGKYDWLIWEYDCINNRMRYRYFIESETYDENEDGFLDYCELWPCDGSDNYHNPEGCDCNDGCL